MWHFTFDAPVNTRILNSRFFGITHFSDSQIWWSEKKRKWMSYEECINYGSFSNTARCRSFKAFKRHLRKHPELKEAGEIVLSSRYVGYSITAVWKE